MTYKERYYRKHRHDKKPMSTRLYEWAVMTMFCTSLLAMFYCVMFGGYFYREHPIMWFVVYMLSVIACVFSFDLRIRDDDKLRKELGIK